MLYFFRVDGLTRQPRTGKPAQANAGLAYNPDRRHWCRPMTPEQLAKRIGQHCDAI